MGEQCVVVTGGSSGIGRACVEAVAATGTKVVNLDRNPAELIPGETFIELDLYDHDRIRDVFADIAQTFDIVGLVNNAGMSLAKTLAETEADDFTKVVPLNMVAPALCAKYAAEAMKRVGWGRIVNMSSRALPSTPSPPAPSPRPCSRRSTRRAPPEPRKSSTACRSSAWASRKTSPTP